MYKYYKKSKIKQIYNETKYNTKQKSADSKSKMLQEKIESSQFDQYLKKNNTNKLIKNNEMQNWNLGWQHTTLQEQKFNTLRNLSNRLKHYEKSERKEKSKRQLKNFDLNYFELKNVKLKLQEDTQKIKNNMNQISQKNEQIIEPKQLQIVTVQNHTIRLKKPYSINIKQLNMQRINPEKQRRSVKNKSKNQNKKPQKMFTQPSVRRIRQPSPCFSVLNKNVISQCTEESINLVKLPPLKRNIFKNTQHPLLISQKKQNLNIEVHEDPFTDREMFKITKINY